MGDIIKHTGKVEKAKNNLEGRGGDSHTRKGRGTLTIEHSVWGVGTRHRTVVLDLVGWGRVQGGTKEHTGVGEGLKG